MINLIKFCSMATSLINLRFIISFRSTEECQTFLSEESSKETSGDGEKVTFDPLDDSLLLVKVRWPFIHFEKNLNILLKYTI